VKPSRIVPLVLSLIVLSALFGTAWGRELRVGTKLTEPFVLRSPSGEWSGISIELWESIAAERGWSFEYREMGLEELLQQTSAGSLDVAVAAFTVTSERERNHDFSHAFYSTGLGVAVRSQGGGWAQALTRLVSLRFLGVVTLLGLLLFAVGSLVWILERRRNAAQFGGTALQGLGSGFWWSAVTMTTVGYGDKAPVTTAGRFVALIWMFAAIIVISSITAALTSALTVSQLGSHLAGPQDLAHVRVGTLQGTAAETLLGQRGISSHGFASMSSGLEALRDGQLGVFVYDEPILRYWVKTDFQGEVQVLPWVFDRQNYAMLLPEGSPLCEPINRTMLEILQKPEWQDLLRRYLGNP